MSNVFNASLSKRREENLSWWIRENYKVMMMLIMLGMLIM